MEIDHEIFSTVILSLSLIQEGQLSVSGERMCTSTGSPLRELSLPRHDLNSVDWLLNKIKKKKNNKNRDANTAVSFYATNLYFSV